MAAMMTDAELTILSIVAEGPRFGYEIQQIIDDRGLREWLTIGFSSIYYILNKLERQKMVSSELRSDGRGPARKVYEITEAGRGVLQTAIADLLRLPRSLGSGFELGLANLGSLRSQQVYKVLRHHHDDLQHRLEAVEKSWQRHQDEDAPDVSDHIRALYTHSIAMMSAELMWMSEFLEDWRTRYPAAENAEADSKNHPVPTEPHSAPTVLHHRTTPDPAKMIQRLKRPPSASSEG
jgi:DNA-binding PadR family transcriptional regulator